MGLEELPNGMIYFNFSEEISTWVEQLWTAITPLHVGIIVICTLILIGIVFSLTLRKLRFDKAMGGQ